MDDNINFKYDYNTEVYYSCAAAWNDEMWVLGGISKKRQVKFLKKNCKNFLRENEFGHPELFDKKNYLR